MFFIRNYHLNNNYIKKIIELKMISISESIPIIDLIWFQFDGLLFVNGECESLFRCTFHQTQWDITMNFGMRKIPGLKPFEFNLCFDV